MKLSDMILAKGMSFFSGGGSGGADELIVKMATNQNYELKSDAVDSVYDSAFISNHRLISVDFPNATNVGHRAFNNCSNLKSAYFESATNIGNGAFERSGIENAKFPSVTEIGASAFGVTTSLKNASFPSAITVDSSAFNNSALEKVDFGAVENIKDGCFYNCENLTAVIIRTTTTVCVAHLTAFESTPMLTGMGYIYVPAAMYEYYRAGYAPSLQEGFFDILFRKIEDYPEICGAV